MSITSYEYEERAFLSEDDFLRVKKYLDRAATKTELDNKKSYFFVLPDRNLSVAVSKAKSVIKYKSGQITKGNGFEEHEFPFDSTSLTDVIGLLSSLLEIEPQYSEQFRINYYLDNKIEIALKYTETWGFHIEIEKVYQAKNEKDLETSKKLAQKDVENVAKLLDVKLITSDDIENFTKECEAGINRGKFSPDDFRTKHGFLFGF